MGGTGVASADYGSGALINPALLARSQPEDDITVILPALQAQITDKDNLEDEIDHISDRVKYYRDVVNSLTPGDIAADPVGTLRQFQGAAGELGDELEYLRGKTASARAAGGIAVSIPERCAGGSLCGESLRACPHQHPCGSERYRLSSSYPE